MDSGSYGQQYPLPKTAGEWRDILQSLPGIKPGPPVTASGVFAELGFKHAYGGLLGLRTHPALGQSVSLESLHRWCVCSGLVEDAHALGCVATYVCCLH